MRSRKRRRRAIFAEASLCEARDIGSGGAFRVSSFIVRRLFLRDEFVGDVAVEIRYLSDLLVVVHHFQISLGARDKHIVQLP